MTDINIPSAAPWIYDLGTRDGTQRVVPIIPNRNRFVPLFFIWAEKGSTRRKWISGDPTTVYGVNSFDPTKKYFNHQTLGGQICSKNGNLVSYQRIVPDDAEEALLFVSLVLEEKDIPDYQRDSSGKIIIDVNTNLPTQIGTVAGRTYRWDVEEAQGKTYEQLLETGLNGITTGNSLPPSAPVSGDVVRPSEVVVLDEVEYTNEGTTDVIVRGVLDEAAVLGAGLTEIGPVPPTPVPGDTIASDITVKYLVDKHIMFNNSGTDIVAPANITLETMINAGLTDAGYVPDALEGVHVPPNGSVIFNTKYYTNMSNVDVVIRELTITEADLVDAGLTKGANWTPAIVTKYPYFIARYNGEGELGNNTGVRLYPVSDSMDSNITDYKRFRFGMEVVARPDRHSNVHNVPTVLNQKTVDFVWEPGASDRYNRPLSLNNLVDRYSNTEDPKYGYKESDFSHIHIFQDSIDASLEVIAVAEKNATAGMEWSDFQAGTAINESGADLKYLVNPITAKHSSNKAYITLTADNSPLAVQLGKYNTIFANGGADGTLDLKEFEQKVAEEIERYADVEDPVQNDARYLETDFWDTGFNADVKPRLHSFTAVRKDLNLAIAVFENDERMKVGGAQSATYLEGDPQDRDTEIALGTYLAGFMNLVPESTKFNTPSMRTTITAGSGKVRGTLFNKRVPLTFFLLNKFSKYCGSAEGKWLTEHAFDISPGHIIDNMYDLSDDWASLSVRTRMWDAGINYHLTYDQDRAMFPVVRSCYTGGDTSVLVSGFNTRICATITRVVHQVWRDFVGAQKLGGDRLSAAINDKISEELKDSFDDMAIIKPMAQIGDLDALRGTSISVPVEVYLNNPLTTFIHEVDALRMSDLLNES